MLNQHFLFNYIYMNSSAKNRKNYIKLNIHIIINVIYSDISSHHIFILFIPKRKMKNIVYPSQQKEFYILFPLFTNDRRSCIRNRIG